MKALITGCSGQDASYLAELLLNKGYTVVGGARRNASGSFWRLERLGIKDRVKIVDFELTEFSNIYNVIKNEMPDEIYNLAAMSFVGSSFSDPLYVDNVNNRGVLRIIEAVKLINPKIKIYQASTSEMFGKAAAPQNEGTYFYPRSPYGVSKLSAHWHMVNNRESHNLFACNGILFNHESPLRGSEFVTKKIVSHCVKSALGLTSTSLKLGNLNAKRDWGFAGDYVEAMYLMMQQDKPEDFVISTGETHTVGEFLIAVCEELNHYPDVVIDPDLYRPAEVDILQGDSSKAKEAFGFQPKVKFKDLVKLMVDEELLCYNAKRNI